MSVRSSFGSDQEENSGGSDCVASLRAACYLAELRVWRGQPPQGDAFYLMTGEADVYERVELLLVVEPGDSNILIKLHEAKQLKRYSNYDSFFFQ